MTTMPALLLLLFMYTELWDTRLRFTGDITVKVVITGTSVIIINSDDNRDLRRLAACISYTVN